MKVHSVNMLVVGDQTIMALKKDIKHVYVRVSPENGLINVTAPLHMKNEQLKEIIASKLDLIKEKCARLRAKQKRLKQSITTGERHFFLGRPYNLNIIHTHSSPQVARTGAHLNLYLDSNSSIAEREGLLEHFYRTELQKLLPGFVAKWSAIMQTEPHEVRIKKMKTRWGSCNHHTKRIWLALALVKTPFQCIEYVFVHEMVHLFEANHGPQFRQLMDQYLPTWRTDERLLEEFASKLENNLTLE